MIDNDGSKTIGNEGGEICQCGRRRATPAERDEREDIPDRDPPREICFSSRRCSRATPEEEFRAAPGADENVRLVAEGEMAYLSLLARILREGERREDRTGTGTLSIFGAQMRFDLRRGFPLLTTKKVAFSAVVRELLWFLRGSTNVRDGLAQHTNIWDAWADENGDLGPIYGHQWRSWGRRVSDPRAADRVSDSDLVEIGASEAHLEAKLGADAARSIVRAARELEARRDAEGCGVDQIAQAIETIRRNPDSRRIIVSAWNVADVPRMRLPPCHLLFQFNVQGGFLDCQLYQRSADMAIGVPFNIASYALLTSMIARECGLEPRHFVHTLGDAHVYLSHVVGVRAQLSRDPLDPPRLVLADKPTLEQTFDGISIEGYRHHSAIRFKVAV